MSHSKQTKRGHSLYIEKWSREDKKYINVCAVCGTRGYSPYIAGEDFRRRNEVVFRELSAMMNELPLDSLGRCADCAAVMDSRQITERCLK